MNRYQKIVDRLVAVLSQEEFLELQELLDGDSDHTLSELISQRASQMAPLLFVSGEDLGDK